MAPRRHWGGTRASLRRHSDGTEAALGRHWGGTRAALRRHSDGTRAALRRHWGGTRAALRRHSDGTEAALGRHWDGTEAALGRHWDGTEAALGRHWGGTQTALRRHSGGTTAKTTILDLTFNSFQFISYRMMTRDTRCTALWHITVWKGVWSRRYWDLDSITSFALQISWRFGCSYNLRIFVSWYTNEGVGMLYVWACNYN